MPKEFPAHVGIIAALEGYSDGLTKEEMADMLGLQLNTINKALPHARLELSKSGKFIIAEWGDKITQPWTYRIVTEGEIIRNEWTPNQTKHLRTRVGTMGLGLKAAVLSTDEHTYEGLQIRVMSNHFASMTATLEQLDIAYANFDGQ
jgi:hypothetical protein